MKISPDIPCLSSDQKYVEYQIISIIGLTLWGLALPIALFFLTKSFKRKKNSVPSKSKFKAKFKRLEQINNEKKLTQTNNFKKIGIYLTSAYNDEFYFWDSTFYLKKLLIVILSILNRFFSDFSSLNALLMLVFFSFLMIFVKFNIYRNRKFQDPAQSNKIRSDSTAKSHSRQISA